MALVYSQLFDLVRRERTHQDLQDLPANFYEDSKAFFDEITAALKADPYNEAERVKVVNGKKLLRQLYEYREQKILHLAQARCRTGSALVDTTRLHPVERQLFEQLVSVLKDARITNNIDDEDKARELAPPLRQAPRFMTADEPASTEAETISVKIIKAVPEFLGKSMETYGPYVENDMVDLPAAVAELLMRKGNAEKN